jgi:YHS domain-containing protein
MFVSSYAASECDWIYSKRSIKISGRLKSRFRDPPLASRAILLRRHFMKSRVAALAIFVLALSTVAGVAALSRDSARPAEQQAEQQQPKEETALQVVENKYVCMINNQRFNRAQIPVEVEGRTYYGCCEMCKGRLSGDARSRVATDPVSGNEVDKAKAVIGANAEGEVFYFENAENLKRYKASPKP